MLLRRDSSTDLESCSENELSLEPSDRIAGYLGRPVESNVSLRGVVVGFLGLFALTVCVGVTAGAFSAPLERHGITARMLLESPEVVDMVADHRMDVRRNFHQPAGLKQWAETRAMVSLKLRKHNADLRTRSPQLAALLDSIVLSEEEKNAMMHLMKHVGDRRVQEFGQVFARAKFESKSMDKASRKHYIVEKLRPRWAELRRLHSDIFGGLPKRMASLGQGDLDSLLQDAPQQRKLAAAGVPGVLPQFYTTPTPNLDMLNQMDGMLDEFQVGLNAFKAMFSDTIKRMNVPILSDLLDASDEFLTEANCALNVGKTYEATQQLPVEKMMQCPLKLGSSGMDDVSAVVKDIGVQDPCDVGIGSNC